MMRPEGLQAPIHQPTIMEMGKSDVPDVVLDHMPSGRHNQYTSTGPIRNLQYHQPLLFEMQSGRTIGETDM